jgi:hypothetical protein
VKKKKKRVKEKRGKRGNITRAHSERKTAHQGVGAAVHHSPTYFSCIHTYLYVKERKINRHIDIQVDDYHGKKDEVRQWRADCLYAITSHRGGWGVCASELKQSDHIPLVKKEQSTGK